MFFAHLPAGYLLSHAMLERSRRLTNSQVQHLLWLGMAASVLPDFDLLYFYLWDARQHPHHSYWTHIPLFWFIALAPPALFAYALRRHVIAWACMMLLINVMLHLVLDSITGGIYWLYPMSEHYFRLLEPPTRYGPWPLNFFLHWSAALEVMLIAAALLHLRRPRYALR